jgi:hypothetical protein
MFNRGGQRRTIEAGCGWCCVGHPTEVNKKYLRHKRYCNDCKEITAILPKFNKNLINGWKGNFSESQKPNQLISSVFVDGERKDIILDGVKYKNNEYTRERLVTAFLEEECMVKVPLSKSQKKRQKQKAKKEAEKEADEN